MNLRDNFISLQEEMFAYEKLYAMENASFKRINEELRNTMPSQYWKHLSSQDMFLNESNTEIDTFLSDIYRKKDFLIGIKHDSQFPTTLIQNKMTYPVPLLYYKGNPDLLDSSIPKISVVGTRNISQEGTKRTKQLIHMIQQQNKKTQIISGLAKGVDTIALRTAIELHMKTIAVIGKPITEYYPQENKKLQNDIAKQHLLISHVPFYRYKKEPFSAKRYHFTERNSVMASISNATIIVEASETSGTRTQARDCLKHNIPLFFLKSCYDTGLQWIRKAVSDGAYILENSDLLWQIIGK